MNIEFIHNLSTEYPKTTKQFDEYLAKENGKQFSVVFALAEIETQLGWFLKFLDSHDVVIVADVMCNGTWGYGISERNSNGWLSSPQMSYRASLTDRFMAYQMAITKSFHILEQQK